MSAKDCYACACLNVRICVETVGDDARQISLKDAEEEEVVRQDVEISAGRQSEIRIVSQFS